MFWLRGGLLGFDWFRVLASVLPLMPQLCYVIVSAFKVTLQMRAGLRTQITRLTYRMCAGQGHADCSREYETENQSINA